MTDGEQPVEARIEELVELEQELKHTSGAATGGVYEEGVIAGAERIPAADVPEDYPVPIESEQALRIDVETDGGIVETYLEWAPDQEGSGHIQQLLDALGRSPDEFASIFGDRVALDHRDGYHGIDADGTRKLRYEQGLSDGFPLGRSGKVVLGVWALAAVTMLLGAGPASPTWAALSWLFGMGLAGAVVYDVRRIDERIHWDPTTVVWGIGALLPLLNVPVGIAYLVRRRVQGATIPSDVVPKDWYYVVVGCLASSVLVFVLSGALTGVAATLYATVVVLLPVAAHFDAELVEAGIGREEFGAVWTVGIAASAVAGFGFLGAAAYLHRRRDLLGK